jgi:hypothetical protein
MNRPSLSLESLFHRALNLSAGPAREAFLAEIADSDSALHGELVSLLMCARDGWHLPEHGGRFQRLLIAGAK